MLIGYALKSMILHSWASEGGKAPPLDYEKPQQKSCFFTFE